MGAAVESTNAILAADPLLDLNIKSLYIGDVVQGVVGIVSRDPRSGARGQFFLYQFGNTTGTIRGVAWSEVAPKCVPFGVGDVVCIEAEVIPGYENPEGRELKIRDIRHTAIASAGEFWGMTLPRFADGPDVLWSRCYDILSRLNAWQTAFFEAVFSVVSKDDFANCPAARGEGHQAYFHGLLEHSDEVAEIGISLSQLPANRGKADEGVVALGALLHDIGKVREYKYDGRGPFALSLEGRLKHHTAIGSEIFFEAFFQNRTKLEALGMTRDHLLHLQHIALSHHGKPEYGSVTEPQSLEALIVHHADMSSAQVAGLRQAVESSATRFDTDGCSTGRVPFYPKGIYRPEREAPTSVESPVSAAPQLMDSI